MMKRLQLPNRLENLSNQIKQLTSKPVLTTVPYIDSFSYENYFNELLKRLETNSDIDPVFVET